MWSARSVRVAGGRQAVAHRLLTTSPASISSQPSVLCRSLSSTTSSASPSSSLSRSITSRTVGYPLLAVSVSLLAVQQLHFHSSAASNATPDPSPSTSTTPSTPASPEPPTFDLTVLPYASKAAFLSQSTVKFYQYQTCPFCNKVRAYLDYMRIPYEVVEVNPMNKNQIKFSGVKTVPVVTVDHLTLHDSSAIITAFDRLFTHYQQKAALTHPTPTSPSQTPSRAEETRWREWVDTHLIFLTAPNLYTSLSASLQAMDYIMGQTSLPLTQRVASKYIGGPMMYFVSEYKLKKKRGITDARGQLFSACREWGGQAVEGKRYRGGDKPDLSDLAVFGVVRAMMGFPVGDELMEAQNTGEAFTDWYRRMEREVGGSSAKNSTGATVGADYRRGAVSAQP